MNILNLIPLGFLVWVLFKAVKDGMQRDRVDRYFQKYRIKSGKKFCNFFGVPNAHFK